MDKKLMRRLLANTTRADMAREFNVDPSTVTYWFKRGNIPPDRVLGLERLTGVSRHDIRPDIYGPAE